MKGEADFQCLKKAFNEKIFHFQYNSLSCADVNRINGFDDDFPKWMICERYKITFEELENIRKGKF